LLDVIFKISLLFQSNMENSKMKRLILIFWFCLNAVPVSANPGGVPNGGVGMGNGYGNEKHMGAPAPLLGLGIPSALAVGGVLFGVKLFGRRRR
jgi:hypothetical protein